MQSCSFAHACPEALGIRSEAVLALLDHLERCGTEMHGLMILRHGQIAAEGWWEPYTKALRHNAWSLSKSYVASAVGAAAAEGRFSLDEPILRYFADEAPAHPSAELQRLKIRDLLSMSCGMEPNRMNWSGDWIGRFFAEPILHEPGTVFFYNNEASSVLAVLVERTTGKNFLEYLYDRVLRKIGVAPDAVSCMQMPDGHAFGAAGIFSTTEANARLGQLYLQKGRWNGEQLLPEEWVRAASSKKVEVTFPKMNEMKVPVHLEGIEHAKAGYGYQMWMCGYPEAYRFDGAMGQYVIVLPTLDMVVAISESSTASREGPMCALNAVFRDLIPQVAEGELPASPAAETLEKRLRCLCLPRLAAGCGGGAGAAGEQIFRLEAGHSFTLTPVIFAHIVGERPALQSIGLRFARETCTLTFHDAEQTFAITAGTDGLPRLNRFPSPLPICGYAAAQGSWLEPGRFTVRLRYPETCFSLDLTFDFAGGPVTVTRTENLTFDGTPPAAAVFALAR